jgi:hypothetical protein
VWGPDLFVGVCIDVLGDRNNRPVLGLANNDANR